MRWINTSAVCALFLLLATCLSAQESDRSRSPAAANLAVPAEDASISPEEARQSLLAWTPPALEVVTQHAEVRNSFVLDRNALRAVQALMPDSEEGVRPAIRKLDGIGVHLYRFHDSGQIDPEQLEAIKQAYRARGWQHLVSSNGTPDLGHRKTDLWLTLDGMTVRGGAMMLVTPKSLSLITFAGT